MASNRRVMKELKRVNECDLCESVGLKVVTNDDDVLNWIVTMAGPDNSPFVGGIFTLNVTFPPDYPFKPPAITFSTPIYHPNISSDGKISYHDLYCSCCTGTWSPAKSMRDLLIGIQTMLSTPDAENAARPEVGQQYMTNLDGYIEAAKNFTKIHAVESGKKVG